MTEQTTLNLMVPEEECTKMKKFISNILRHIQHQHRSDTGSDVLVVGMILFPILVIAIGFALDVSKNVYLSNSYVSMAEEAVAEASQQRNIYDELTRSSGTALVQEYRIQRGDTVANAGTQTRETAAFRSGCQNSMTMNDIGLSGEGSVSLPYIVLNYENERGFNTSETLYTSQGGAAPDMSGYQSTGRHVVEATIYETGNNFLLGMFGGDCQVYKSNVSSLSITADGQDIN